MRKLRPKEGSRLLQGSHLRAEPESSRPSPKDTAKLGPWASGSVLTVHCSLSGLLSALDRYRHGPRLSSSYFSNRCFLSLARDPLPAAIRLMSPRHPSLACCFFHSIHTIYGSSFSSAHVVSTATYTPVSTKSLFSSQNIQLPAGHSIWLSLSPSKSLSSIGTPSSLFSTLAGITIHPLIR